VFLYEVTSVYFEGQDNELAAFGYNRDGKRGKQQMVAGLLTVRIFDFSEGVAEGESLAVGMAWGAG
jgi:hypothetical protein